MRQSICLLLVLLMLVAACAPSPGPVATETASPTPVDTPPTTPATRSARDATPPVNPLPGTLYPTATPLLTPTPSPILSVFPLEPGMSWVYTVTWQYWDRSGDPLEGVHWAGFVTRTVSSVQVITNGLLFQIDVYGLPDIASEHDLHQEYRVENDRILGIERDMELVWPLEAGQTLGVLGGGEPQADGQYVWTVDGPEDVQVPAGDFSGCYVIAIFTRPDNKSLWVCPQVGIVRQEYNHHGSVDNRYWELRRVIWGNQEEQEAAQPSW